MQAIQQLLRQGALGHTRLQTSAANWQHLKCSSCQYGKARRWTTPSKTTTPVKPKEGALKREDLFPGQQVSIDHFICSSKGRLYSSQGKSPDEQMYSGGCIFVDHATWYVHVEHQVHLVQAPIRARHAEHGHHRRRLSEQ